MERIEFTVGTAGNIRIIFRECPIGSLLRNIKGIYTFYPMYEIRNQIMLREDWELILKKWKELEDGEKDKRKESSN